MIDYPAFISRFLSLKPLAQHNVRPGLSSPHSSLLTHLYPQQTLQLPAPPLLASMSLLGTPFPAPLSLPTPRPLSSPFIPAGWK